MNPHTHVRDDAEGALGADKELTQIGGACSGCRRTPGLDHSTRGGDNGEALNHVLEAPVSSRRLPPRRPGGGKPAQSGEQEALREVPDRETVLTQKLLGPWAGSSAAERRNARFLVQPDKLIEPAQIERKNCVEPVTNGIEPADDAGATTERDHCDPVGRAVSENLLDLCVCPWSDDCVRCVLRLDATTAQQIRGGALATGPKDSIRILGTDVLGPDQPSQRFDMRLGHSGRSHLDVFDGETRSSRCGDTEKSGQQ